MCDHIAYCERNELKVEIDRLRAELTNLHKWNREAVAAYKAKEAELANARLERDNITSLNSSLIAKLATRDARIARLEEELAGINGLHGQMYEAWSDERARAERAETLHAQMSQAWDTASARAERAEAERDEERLMRKLYEDAAKHWQSLAEGAEAEIAEAMDRLCYTAGECDLVTACEHWVAHFHEANVRAERAEAELKEWMCCAEQRRQDRDKAEAALSFYADERNWHTPPHCYSAAVSDCGTKARTALAPSPAGEKT